ncbi:MAG: Rieske 2Fe-2S domain-containing protein [Oceanicoccus sp.]
MITVLHVNDIDDESSKALAVGDDNYFAVKKDGQIYLYRNKCPHLGIELNWQEDQFLDMDGALIQCSTHGALFLIEDGECVSGPCLGERLESMPFEIIEGNIVLTK